jgi:hypothetical protein
VAGASAGSYQISPRPASLSGSFGRDTNSLRADEVAHASTPAGSRGSVQVPSGYEKLFLPACQAELHLPVAT